LSSVEQLRYKKAIPPEDKATPTVPSLPHARDVWAFGHLVLAALDKANLNGTNTISLVFILFCPHFRKSG